MNEKITLSGVPETMLQTVYARARESSGRGAIRDRKAEEIIDRLDYDFSLAERDSAMRSGVIARTIVLDRLTAAWLSDGGVCTLVQSGSARDDGGAGASPARKWNDFTDRHVCNGGLGRGDQRI